MEEGRWRRLDHGRPVATVEALGVVAEERCGGAHLLAIGEGVAVALRLQ